MHASKRTSRRNFLKAASATAVAAALPRTSFAADPVRVALILPLTGPFASTGRQIEAAVRLYMARNGDSVAIGKHTLIFLTEQSAAQPNDFAKTVIINPPTGSRFYRLIK